MTCDDARERIAASWLGETDTAAGSELSLHLAQCPECRAEMAALSGLWNRLADLPAPEPSQELDARWESTMDAVLAGLPKTVPRPRRRSLADFWPRQIAWQMAFALACLVAGIVAGTAWRHDNSEIARLREEVAGTRAMVALSLLQQQSATDRLRGIDYSGRLSTLDPDVVTALVQAVDHDPSVNVRLAAIDALSRAANNAAVLRSFTASLPQQDSPMVQAALVDYLAGAHDRQAVGTLRRLAAQPELNPAVRERTQLALQQLTQ